MTRQLFDIWKDPEPPDWVYPWRAQLSGYVGRFETQEQAEKYVNSVKAYRERWGNKS